MSNVISCEMSRKFKEVSLEEIIDAIKEAEYLGSILTSLDCIDNSYNRKKLKEFIENNKVDTSHIKTRLTRETYELNPKRCKLCGEIIPWEKHENEFCSHSCSAIFNNTGSVRVKKEEYKNSYCLNCGKPIPYRNKFCNLTCKSDYEYKEYIERWLNGEETGLKGIDAISNYVKRYIFTLHNNSCEKCGWNLVNEFTGKIPLQIHHIDGDCLNNRPENLQLLCPNCHSLTENFGSRNEHCTRTYKRTR